MDRRIRRSKKVLKEAFISLLAEKNFDKITVKELVDKADINRSTFYAHYDGKEGLLHELIEKLMGEVRKQALEPYRNKNKAEYFISIHSKLIGLFELLYKEQGLLGAIMKSELNNYLRGCLLEVLLSISIKESKFYSKPDTPLDMKLYKHHAVFGLVGLICYWIETGFQYKPDELLKEYTKFERNPPYKFVYTGNSL